MVYPGAYHTRFHHALGAMHLMQKAVDILRYKGHEITSKEEEAVCIAILLHDIGHGPFSHALEKAVIPSIMHEKLSLEFMNLLNQEFDGALDLAIQIFTNQHSKKFLHQLISSQLDMDRLDYLRRDSFYTGVSEGSVNVERLITMLNIHDDELVIDAKGIYSVEKFIIARRLMYWQVYLHKTVLSAEFTLIKILERARFIGADKLKMPAVLVPFIQGNLPTDFRELLGLYSKLDDYDIMAAIKEWSTSNDLVLRTLCTAILDRKLLAVEVQTDEITDEQLKKFNECCQLKLGINKEEADYLVFFETMSNSAYNPNRDRINLLYKNGQIEDIASAADQLNISALSGDVRKHFLFYPKACKG